MFCRTCGAKLPEDSRLCPECGAQLASEAASQTRQGISEHPRAASTVGSEASLPRRLRLPLVIGGIVLVLVAAASAFVSLWSGNTAATATLPNGTFTFNDVMAYGFSYRILDGDDGETIIQLGDLGDAGRTFIPMYEGVLREDGSNDQGTIWKVENLEALDDGFVAWPQHHSNIRVQFPAGAAAGEVEGRWYFESEVASGAGGKSTIEFAIREFDEDGRARWVSGSGEGVIDRGLTYDEVLASDSLDIEMTLEDGDYDDERGGYGSCTWRSTGDGRFEVINSDGIVVMKVHIDLDDVR